jgi:enoyl-CoA hydratase/carnithine racemase
VDAQEQDVTGPLLIEHDDGIDRVCSRSEEFSEGIQAFLEKRKPVYIRR